MGQNAVFPLNTCLDKINYNDNDAGAKHAYFVYCVQDIIFIFYTYVYVSPMTTILLSSSAKTIKPFKYIPLSYTIMGQRLRRY